MIPTSIFVIAELVLMLGMLFSSFMVNVSSKSHRSGHPLEKKNSEKFLDFCYRTMILSFSLASSILFVISALAVFQLATSSIPVLPFITYLLYIVVALVYIFYLLVYNNILENYYGNEKGIRKDFGRIVTLKAYKYLTSGKYADLFE